MSTNSWEETLSASVTDATQISNSTAETVLVPDFTVPANYLVEGRTIQITLIGKMSNVVTTPGTLTFRCRWGGVAGTLLVASAAIALNIVAQTNAQVIIQLRLTCRTKGNPGTLIVSGWCCLGLSASVTGRVDLIPASGQAAVGTLDLVSATALSVTAQFSVNTNPTNIQIQQATYESLN